MKVPHGADERVFDVSIAAQFPGEVVHIDGPDHGAAKIVLFDPRHLDADGALVIETDPLVAHDQVGHLHLIVPGVGGFARAQHLAHLVVGQNAGLARVDPLVAAAGGSVIDSEIPGVGQCERAAVRGHADDELLARAAQFHPQVGRVVHRQLLAPLRVG